MKFGSWTFPECGLHWPQPDTALRKCSIADHSSIPFSFFACNHQPARRSCSRHRGISRPARASWSSNSNFSTVQSPHSAARRAGICTPLPWQTQGRRAPSKLHSSIQEEVLLPLGLDFLTFLAATVIVIPVFKSVKASPVLGFLFSGLILGQLGYAPVSCSYSKIVLAILRPLDECCVLIGM